MPNPPNITQITPPRVAIIDERTGDVSREWYRFFYNLYYAVGGTNAGAIPPSRGGTGTSQIPTDGDLLIGNGSTGNYNCTQLMLGNGLEKVVGHGSLALENTGVLSFSAGTTGFTPSTVSTGDIVLDGILGITHGGTGADNATDARANLGAAGSGDNTDITSLQGLTGPVRTPTYVEFNTAPGTIPTTSGSLYWDAADGNQTLSLRMANPNVIQQIGEEIYYRIKATSAITNGQVVMFTGSVGASGALTGAPASGLTSATASYLMGIATEDIPLNGWGYVTQFGLVRGIDTTGGAEAWVDGQILYYNPSVPGGLTKTIPSAPNAKIQVCAVVNAASGGSGSLFVRSTYGGSLGQFEGNVQITSGATGQVLTYNATTGVWSNQYVAGGTF